MSSGSATDAPANGRDFPVAIRSPNDWLIVWVLVALLVGTLGLLLPAAHQGHLSLIDALLLATSAVCTTGLSSVNVGQVLTPAGQLWLAVLIEVGALALLVLILRFVGWGKQAAAADWTPEALGLPEGQNFRHLLLRVVLLTLGIQFAGFLVLLPDMIRLTGPLQGARYALLHAVMAFGNAGFGLWPDGVARLAPLSLLTLMLLVVLGSTGFIGLDELDRYFYGRFRRQTPLPGLSAQTRVGLKVTTCLLVGGALLFALLEWHRPGTLGPLDPPHKLLHAAFQTTVTRSAGFSTLDYGHFSAPTLLLIMSLMFVGGNPGSTAGGIKTTVLAVLLSATRATLRGQPQAQLEGRAIPVRTLMRALTVVTLALLAVGLGTGALMFTDHQHRPIVLAFEAVSAFTTSGLSVNLTPVLSDHGKLVLVALMFLGRVGFLSLLLAFHTTHAIVDELPEEQAFNID